MSDRDLLSDWRAPHLTGFTTPMQEVLLSLEDFLRGTRHEGDDLPSGQQPIGRIFTGKTKPDAALAAQPGDLYVDKQSGDVYVMDGSPTYDGARVWATTAAPTAGASGDLAVDVALADLYHNTGTRPTGLQWWTGAGDPAIPADTGDRYIDTTSAAEHLKGA